MNRKSKSNLREETENSKGKGENAGLLFTLVFKLFTKGPKFTSVQVESICRQQHKGG